MGKISKQRIAVVLAVVLPLLVVVLGLTISQVAITSEICRGGLPLSATNHAAVPQSVLDDATRLAAKLFGDSPEKYDNFVNQLLGTYLEAKDKDFVLLFNSGGWGQSLIETSPGWLSIFTGIESELNSRGYTSLLLTHQRTADTLAGRLDEIVEMITGYPSKAKDLAYRVEFLLSHIPRLRVIIAGESNGAVISDRTMDILADNPRVYCIQTGPPFWYDSAASDRTLVVTYNGRYPDSFSRGEFLTMIRASLRALLGLPQPENESGTIFRFIRAPGHDYWWQYPEVYSQITEFLNKNFGIKQSDDKPLNMWRLGCQTK